MLETGLLKKERFDRINFRELKENIRNLRNKSQEFRENNEEQERMLQQ